MAQPAHKPVDGLQIEHVEPSALKPAPYNPRQMDAEERKRLERGIREFGLVDPIVARRSDHMVIGGHQRLASAKSLGLKSVPVVYLDDISDDRAAALNILLNNPAAQGEWDLPKLTDILSELDAHGFDATLTGFDDEELRKMLAPAGDLLTDPPYGVEYDPNWRNEADRANGKPYGARAVGTVTNDEKADWTGAWALFPGDVVYCWHAGRHAATVQRSLEDTGFEMRSQIIWAKSRLIISRGHYHWQHEPCWYAFRKGSTAHWIGGRSQTTLWEIEHAKSDTGHGTQKPVEAMRRPLQNHEGDVYDPFLGSGTTLIAAEMMGRTCYGIEISPAYCDVIITRWENATGQKAVRP